MALLYASAKSALRNMGVWRLKLGECPTLFFLVLVVQCAVAY